MAYACSRNRRAADQEIADEVSHYLEESESALIAKGLSPDEARRAARLELGTATAIREQVRSYGWENTMDTLFADLRYAARRLGANPSFSVVSVLTLALGIGATVAIFTVLHGVLLKPLPYPHSEELVDLSHTAPGIKMERLNLAQSLYFTYREENRVFPNVAMWDNRSWTITGMAEPERVQGLTATHRFLATLGIQPVLGRAFTAADDDPNSERTVMLSDGYWKSRFAGDRSVLGRRIVLDGDAYSVIGVLPQSFEFMDRTISLLVPMRISRASTHLISFCCKGIARLKPGCDARAGERGCRSHAAHGAGEVRHEPRVCTECVHGCPHRSAASTPQGRSGGKYRRHALGADGYRGHCAVDRMRQCGQSPSGPLRRTPA